MTVEDRKHAEKLSRTFQIKKMAKVVKQSRLLAKNHNSGIQNYYMRQGFSIEREQGISIEREYFFTITFW